MAVIASWSKARRGVVTDFDEGAGLGTVVGGDAGRYGFHCTALADGTRQVLVGTEVVFRLRAGHLGRIEATDLVKVALPDHG